MRITFLGTADSSGYPHPFCGCANCAEARGLGGPSIRLRSSALVNDDLLIDLLYDERLDPVLKKISTCQKQSAPALVLTPYPWHNAPSHVRKYHGITRSGTMPRHARSP